MKQFEVIEGIALKKLSFQSKAEAFGFLGGNTSVAGLGRLGALRFCHCFTGSNPSGSSSVWPFTNKTRSHVPVPFRCMEEKREIVDMRFLSSREPPNGQLVHVPAFLPN